VDAIFGLSQKALKVFEVGGGGREAVVATATAWV
jgi:hypothetical protein